MNITKVQISPIVPQGSEIKRRWIAFRNRYIPIRFYQDDRHYRASVIQSQDQYFYQVGNTTIQITAYEYEKVIQNPRLYYFSSALKLHHRLAKAKELGLGMYWPEHAAAPIDLFDQINQVRSSV